jgi:asparagine N-glycosylation enzyme membrane subunit Stt3
MAEDVEVKSEITEVKKEPIVVEKATESVNKPVEKTTFTDFLKKNWFWIFIIVLLAVILVFNVVLRTQNVSQLKDVTTNQYTLGPDLDPFLYLRLAKDIAAGKLQDPDMMVQAPLGYTSYAKMDMMPHSIVFIYKILSLFGSGEKSSIEFAAVIAPVIFFTLSIIVFFLFIFFVFSFNMGKKKSAIIALIASLLYVVMPEMLHRTVAGIPEIESLGMLWFWSAFLFFTLAWKSNKLKSQIIMGVISGIFTGFMIFTWGGFRYIFMAISLATFLIFFFNKDKKKNLLLFSSWFIPAIIIYSLKIGFIPSIKSLTDGTFAFAIFLLLIIDQVIFNTKLKSIKEKIKLPESIITLIVVAILGILLLLVFNPSFLGNIFSGIFGGLLHPFGEGRIGLTVAENNAPYFSQVSGSFSWIFWFFFFGLILLFYFAVKNFDQKKRWWFFALFIIFLVTFIFSRISSSSVLNGNNTISKILYFGGLIVFVLFLLITYIVSYVKKDEKTINDFKEIPFNYILLLALSFWMIVSMRGAIRLFFIISPVLALISAYLPVKIFDISMEVKEKVYKFLLWAIVLLVAILLIINFVKFEKYTSQQAQYTVNGAYYQQWQKAMSWVREETPEGSIFVHWWDYGYWVQTLGERPTVTDGGHINNFWDHLTARYLMTAQNEKTALQLCKAYNVSYYLIDSTDIGKYSAFASIGSDKTGTDRLSWVSTFIMNEQQTQESKNETTYVYTGGTMLDQDFSWKGNFFPMQRAGIGAVLLVIDKKTQAIQGLNAVMIYKNQQYLIPIKYMWINGQIRQVNQDGLDSMLYIVPSVGQNGMNNIGAGLYLSKKALSTQWVRLYLLNDTENFELAHNEPSLFVRQLRDVYNLSVGNIIFAGDIQGPIKIWKVNYPKEIEYHEEYLKSISPEGHWAELDYLGV